LVSLRKARSEGILLENSYWRDAIWQKYYKEQLQAAHTLLGMFEESLDELTKQAEDLDMGY